MTERPRCVVLVGARATGKTAVGRAVAAALEWPFVDGDDLVAAVVGESAGAFLRRVGEVEFRQVEQRETLRALAVEVEQVCALGGGAVLADRVRAILRQPECFVVELRAPLAQMVERQRGDGSDRPALTDLPLEAEIAAVLERRQPLYDEVADLVVLNSGLLAVSVDAIVAALRGA